MCGAYLVVSVRVLDVLSDELHALDRLLDLGGVSSLAVEVTPAEVCKGGSDGWVIGTYGKTDLVEPYN